MTFYPFIKIDLINAKGEWQNKLEVSDRRLVTSRNPNDLDAFNKKIIEGIKEGKH
jgi:protease I